MKTKSLVAQLSLILAIAMLVLLPFIAVSSIVNYNSLTENTINSLKSSLLLHKNQMESDLEHVAAALDELASAYIEDNRPIETHEELAGYFASLQLVGSLYAKISNVAAADGFFASSTTYDTYLVRSSTRINSAAQVNLENYIKSDPPFENDAITGRWHLHEISGDLYLMKVYDLLEAKVGAVVRLNTLLATVVETNTSPDAQFAFQYEEDGIYPANAAGDGRYQLSVEVATTPLHLVGLWPVDSVYAPATWWLLAALAAVAVVVVIISALYLYRRVVKPVQVMLEATTSVERGETEYQITESAKSAEFKTLFASFNSMMQELRALKIEAYEEEIDRQKSQLQYLQMQIRPHFYLNAITTISSLAYQERNDDIQKFISGLSDYLRYNFTDYAHQVTVEQEMAHAVDYIRLQQIKYPGNIFYMEQVSPTGKDLPVPKFIVQTFVENIFKHAFRHGEALTIFLSSEPCEREGKSYLRIRIDDNGEGFGAFLEEFKSGEAAARQVGVFNIRQTLRLQYGCEDLLELSNIQPHGARVDIYIPMEGQ